MDATYRKRYFFGTLPPGFTPRQLIEDGTFQGPEPERPRPPVQHRPRDALADGGVLQRIRANGIDKDFRRGDGIYDRYYSDPTVQPNPNLAPIENAAAEARQHTETAAAS